MRVSILNKLVAIGNKPTDNNIDKLNQSLLIYIGLALTFGGLIWGGICLYFDLPIQASIPLGYGVLTLINFIVFGVTKAYKFARTFQIFISVMLPFLFQWSLGGFVPSGAAMLWAMVALISMITIQSTAHNFFWLGVYVMLTIVSGYINNQAAEYFHYVEIPEFLSTIFFVLNIAIISLCAVGLNIYFVKRHETLQKDLKSSEKKLKAIVEYIGKAIINIDKNGTILFVNKDASDIFGYFDYELEGKNICDILLRKTHEQNNVIMRKDATYIKNLLLNVSQHSGKDKKNKVFPLSTNFSLVKMDGEETYVGVLEDTVAA
jgi:PAS domain S-box-containing protein